MTPQRRRHRQPRRPDGGQESADETHDQGVDETADHQRRGHREGEGHLAEGLPVERRGMEAPARDDLDSAADVERRRRDAA
jgi:hypothetical protein